MWGKCFSPLWVFLQTHNSSVVMGKTSDKSKWKDMLPNSWPILLKIVKVMGNKEKLKKYHRPEESNTKAWWLNTMWCPGWNPGTEKASWWNPNPVWSLVHSHVSILVPSFDKCVMVVAEANTEETGWRVYRVSPYYLCHLSVNPGII